MDEDTFNMELRKFLKKVGITSQREIEHSVQQAIESGKINEGSPMEATMTLTIPALDLTSTIQGTIRLE